MISKILILFLILTTLLIFQGCSNENNLTGMCTKDCDLIEDVTSENAKQLILDNIDNKNFVILDIRTKPEYDEYHLENAINIDFNLPSFHSELSQLDKTKTYLVYCRSGRRSSLAMNTFKELNFQNIYHMNTGIITYEDYIARS